MQSRMIGVLVAVLAYAIVSSTAQSAVYKCPLPGGGSEYRDRPCAGDAGEEVQIRGDDGSRSAGADTGASGAALLQGPWCEFAVSMDMDGQRDSSAPAQWTFGTDTVSYAAAGMDANAMGLRREGASFYVDDGWFGGADAAWTVVARRGNEVVVKGPLVGYYHFRPGRC